MANRTRKSTAAATVAAQVEATPAPAPVQVDATSNKRTIEKDRPKQNGVTRPSAGGLCRAVWDLCDAVAQGTPNTVTLAAVKGAAPPSLNPTNVAIEYYQWRKFNGVSGRVVAPKVAPTAEATAS